jgi:hypothetical protein
MKALRSNPVRGCQTPALRPSRSVDVLSVTNSTESRVRSLRSATAVIALALGCGVVLSSFMFLTNPWLVGSWYATGLVLALWVAYDVLHTNTSVNAPLKMGWPIVIFFFSILGFALYLWTCRAPRLAPLNAREREVAHHDYVANGFSKVTGSVVHCVAGDGLGIVTAMVIGRYMGLSFRTEFAGEYVAGFLFGWMLFQYPALKSMGNSSSVALWKGGRAEFFSMLTLMTGMLLATKLIIQPHVLQSPPLPNTYAFWGIASFALLIGTFLTYPMNWWLVSIGWKHGMT